MTRSQQSDKPERAKCRRCARITIFVAIVEALAFLALKVGLGVVCGSRALIAAGLYSVQDLVSAVVAAIGLRFSTMPPDREHPYGHGKIEYIVVLVVSLLTLLGVIALSITALPFFSDTISDAEPPSLLALLGALVCGVSCWLLAGFQGCAARHL